MVQPKLSKASGGASHLFCQVYGYRALNNLVIEKHKWGGLKSTLKRTLLAWASTQEQAALGISVLC